MTDAYRFFFNNFGSAYRTKHIRLQWANPALRIFNKGLKRSVRAVRRNNRPYHLPWRGPLPKEFIRLGPWEGQYVFLTRAWPNVASSRSAASTVAACF